MSLKTPWKKFYDYNKVFASSLAKKEKNGLEEDKKTAILEKKRRVWKMMGRFGKKDRKTGDDVVDTLLSEPDFRLEETDDSAVFDEAFKQSLPPDIAVYYEDSPPQPQLDLAPVALDVPEFSEPLTASFLAPYIDELMLFEKRWGYDKGAASREEWCRWAADEVVPVFKNLLDYTQKERIFALRSAVVYVEADAVGETVRFFKADGTEPFWTKTFPRLPDGRSLADYFKQDAVANNRDTVALIAVTAGKKAQDTAKKWILGGHETDFRYLDGLAREAVAAMTLYTAKSIVEHGACVGRTLTFPEKEPQKTLEPLLEALQASHLGIGFSKTGVLSPMYASVSFVCPR